MATTSYIHFEPTTDGFGQLSFHARRGLRALPANLLIVLAFVAVFVMVLTGLAFADQAAYGHEHAGSTYYGGVQLDYD